MKMNLLKFNLLIISLFALTIKANAQIEEIVHKGNGKFGMKYQKKWVTMEDYDSIVVMKNWQSMDNYSYAIFKRNGYWGVGKIGLSGSKIEVYLPFKKIVPCQTGDGFYFAKNEEGKWGLSVMGNFKIEHMLTGFDFEAIKQHTLPSIQGICVFDVVLADSKKKSFVIAMRNGYNRYDIEYTWEIINDATIPYSEIIYTTNGIVAKSEDNATYTVFPYYDIVPLGETAFNNVLVLDSISGRSNIGMDFIVQSKVNNKWYFLIREFTKDKLSKDFKIGFDRAYIVKDNLYLMLNNNTYQLSDNKLIQSTITQSLDYDKYYTTFNPDIWIIKKDSKFYLYNPNTKQLISPTDYDAIVPIKDNVGTIYFGVLKNKKNGLLDSTGTKTILDINYLGMAQFIGAEFIVINDNKKFGIFNARKREQVIPMEYDDIKKNENGYILKKNGKWGMLNKNYIEAIPFVYDSIVPFHINTLLQIIQNKKVGLFSFDVQKVILKPEYDNLYDEFMVENNFLSVPNKEIVMAKKNGLPTYVDVKNGEIISQTALDQLKKNIVQDRLEFVYDASRHKSVMLNHLASGKWKIEGRNDNKEYDEVYYRKEKDYFAVREGNKFIVYKYNFDDSYTDKSFTLATDESIEEIFDEFILYSKKGKYGVKDYNNYTLVYADFDKITLHKESRNSWDMQYVVKNPADNYFYNLRLEKENIKENFVLYYDYLKTWNANRIRVTSDTPCDACDHGIITTTTKEYVEGTEKVSGQGIFIVKDKFVTGNEITKTEGYTKKETNTSICIKCGGSGFLNGYLVWNGNNYIFTK